VYLEHTAVKSVLAQGARAGARSAEGRVKSESFDASTRGWLQHASACAVRVRGRVEVRAGDDPTSVAVHKAVVARGRAAGAWSMRSNVVKTYVRAVGVGSLARAGCLPVGKNTIYI
jgi:hypothetical protein